MRTWKDIKRIKHQYRLGYDRDYLLEKYPDIADYIEVEDFLFRLKSQEQVRQRRGHNIFSFENALAQQVAQMLSE